jgi:hypothetical protein
MPNIHPVRMRCKAQAGQAKKNPPGVSGSRPHHSVNKVKVVKAMSRVTRARTPYVRQGRTARRLILLVRPSRHKGPPGPFRLRLPIRCGLSGARCANPRTHRGGYNMIRKCAWCGIGMGELEPLEVDGVTHGICPGCCASMLSLAGPPQDGNAGGLSAPSGFTLSRADPLARTPDPLRDRRPLQETSHAGIGYESEACIA